MSPADPMVPDGTIDLLILGGGSGGYSCALRAAQLGLRVVLVEEAELGGTCLHRGCIPTKALLHAAEVADSVRHSADLGLVATLDGVDGAALHRYRDRIVNKLYRGLRGLVPSRGIEVVEGRGTIVAPRTVEVAGRRLTGRHLVVATGSHTRPLPGMEFDGRRVLGSEHALQLDHVPDSAVVVGGGVIGSEMASAWRSLGADVTLVEAMPRLVAGEEPEASHALARAFGRRGIDVRTAVAVEKLEVHEDRVRVHLDEEGATPIDADVLLVAVGRDPSTLAIGLGAGSVECHESSHVRVDERLCTTEPSTYAVGDVVQGPQLAHRGFAHGIFVAEQVAGLEPMPVDDDLVARVTYTDPEIASVGLTEGAAEARYGADAVRTVTYDLAGNGRSQIRGTQGHVRLVARVDGPILGVHAVGAGAGEMIGEGMLATAWEALPQDAAPLVHAHPTQHEAIGEAILALAGKPLHSHS